MNKLVKGYLLRQMEDNLASIKFSERIQIIVDNIRSKEKFSRWIEESVKACFFINDYDGDESQACDEFVEKFNDAEELIASLENYLPDGFSIYIIELEPYYDNEADEKVTSYQYNFLIGTEEEIIKLLSDVSAKC